MAKTDKNLRIKRDRRAIMASLNMCYPGSLPGDELFNIVLDGNPEYTRTFLIRDWFYLRDKKYIEITRIDGTTMRNVSVDLCKCVLTAAGTDVANQLVDDPTLDV
jgi:hypothetical protein